MPPRAKKPANVIVAREVIYPRLEVNGQPIPPARITCQMAKEVFLGWTEEVEGGEKFGDDFHLKDINGVKVRLLNNGRNRQLTYSWCLQLAYDILNRFWADSRNTPPGTAPEASFTTNGETIIIGRTGQVLSAQHRLIALVLACQIWAGKDKAHWQKLWPEEPSIEAYVITGVDESQTTTKTLDNVKPRTMADVLFTDSTFFPKMKSSKERGRATRILEYAVRTLWKRTWAKRDAFHPTFSHSEALDFIQRHERIKKAVQHIYEEDSAGGVSKYVSPGVAAGLLYLMGYSTADPASVDKYRESDSPSERKLKLDQAVWDKAEDFFTLLAQQDTQPEFVAVRDSCRPGTNSFYFAKGEERGSEEERVGILIKAWGQFLSTGKTTPEGLKLRYDLKDGDPLLDEWPTLKGIDRGTRKDEGTDSSTNEGNATVEVGEQDSPPLAQEEVQEDGPAEGDPTPEEIAARTAEVQRLREEKEQKDREDKKAKLLANRAAKKPPVPKKLPTASGESKEDYAKLDAEKAQQAAS
jgi:hypothetical protein